MPKHDNYRNSEYNVSAETPVS